MIGTMDNVGHRTWKSNQQMSDVIYGSLQEKEPKPNTSYVSTNQKLGNYEAYGKSKP